ncbi:hypothetical protein WN51_01718 [Melipona quadrifasciata]|uniref:Uncharacterized protein n=1 Tax=Melipona quadrifasciata TaxID=166423 RepID=A0A0N1IT95_9HYME|nr:hypothetical protein WN51_01718 [Melipona quadrifasciata]
MENGDKGRWRRSRRREEVKGNRETREKDGQLWGPLRTKDEPPVDSVSNEEEKQKCWWNKGERPALGLRKEKKKKVKEEIYLYLDFAKVRQSGEERCRETDLSSWCFPPLPIFSQPQVENRWCRLSIHYS